MSLLPLSAVSFENVCYSYPGVKNYALYKINLSVMQGEFLAVMGENGSGKTTLCKMVNGIIPLLAGGKLTGSVTVDGVKTDSASVPQLSRKVGMVLDDPDAQLFTSTVRQEAAFGPENLLVPPLEIEERVRRSLSAVGLTGFEERQPASLSGGEKQRLSIAAALAMNGKILVLDEPLCRLDPQGKEEVMSVLKDLKEKFQITIIMSTHDSAQIAEYADRVCVLKNGQIATVDTAIAIFSNHALLEENGIEIIREELTRSTRRYEAHGGREEYWFLYRDLFKADSAEKDIKLSNNNFLPSSPPCLRVKDLYYSYGDGSASIENINLEIADNDFAAIAGGNGCGKTTLLKNITGLLRPFSGEIFIRGRNVRDLTVGDISKEIGFVMQNPDTQLFTDTVFKEASFALKNARLPKNEIKRRVQEALDTVGLKDADAFPHALSRADRIKTLIACVLVMGCRIIILDEIDVGQDYRTSRHIMNILKELHSKGFTIIFVTHNMNLAHEYAHRLIVMTKKGIEFDGKK